MTGAASIGVGFQVGVAVVPGPREALAECLELAAATWRQGGELKALRRELLAVLADLGRE